MGNGPFRCEKCGAGFDGLRCPECNASASVRQTILHYAVEDQQKTKELCKKQKRRIHFLICLIVIIVAGVYLLDAVNFRTTLKVKELSNNLRFHAEIDSAFEGYSEDYCSGYYDGFEHGSEIGLTLSDRSQIYEEGVSDGKQYGYDTAVAEFCYNGDAQYGGWYEGYEEGYEQYRRDAFSDPEVLSEFLYDFFELYCDSDSFAEYVDKEAKGWRKYMPSNRALR